MFELKPGKAIKVNVENFGKLVNEINRVKSENEELRKHLQEAIECVEGTFGDTATSDKWKEALKKASN